MAYHEEISFKQELLRKGIHLISLSIPVLYIFLNKEIALIVLIPVAVIIVGLDILSKEKNAVHDLVYRFFGKMLRPHEIDEKFVLNGASWVLLSAIICVLIFPKIIMVTAFTILIISDSSAAIFGRKYGKHKIFKKSWEGTIAFILSSIMVIIIYGLIFSTPITFFLFGIIASIVGGFIEAASSVIKIDDNLTIPMSVGLVMWGGGIIANMINLPYLNIL